MTNELGGELASTKVAVSFIDAMKAQPLALGLCVMNIGLLLLFWAILNDVTKRNHERELIMATEQKEVRELLSTCIVPVVPVPVPPELK